MNSIIHNIGSFAFNNYVIETPWGQIVIDTGNPEDMDSFIRKFEKKWPLSSIKFLFLTHSHSDHAGFSAELLKKTGAKLIVHQKAVEPLSKGATVPPDGAGYPTRLSAMMGKFSVSVSYPPVAVRPKDIVLHTEEEQVFKQMGLPIQIVFLPGHTADSIGLYLQDSGQLFCGDAAMNIILSFGCHSICIDNLQNYSDSWNKMLALQPKKIYPSHGLPILYKSLQKNQNFMQGRTLL